MKAKEILSAEELKQYHEEWEQFKQKYVGVHPRIQSEYNVHSGKPVISRIFQFQGKPIFRAHVFQKRLKSVDPYFISNNYIHKSWHAWHYFIVMEQMYHASSNLIRDNSKLVGKDIPETFRWRRPIEWVRDRGKISVELTIEDLGKKNNHQRERGHYTFYHDSKNRVISEISVLAFWQPRKYVENIERLRQRNQESLKSLERQIKDRESKHKRLLKPRKLKATAPELIERLRQGEIPEEELHDYFSFWEPTPKQP